MIKALRKRPRPDNMVNQVRAGGKSLGRRIYLGTVLVGLSFMILQLVGPMLFLEADGLAMKDRTVVASLYNARVMGIHVKPGDQVAEGTVLMTLQSTEMLDRLSDVASKRATISARESQIRSRLSSLNITMPSARDRLGRARANLDTIRTLASKQLTTSVRQTESAREYYEAEREEQQLIAEKASIENELKSLVSSLTELDTLINSLRVTFNDGKVVAPTNGTVGARVPHAGQVLKVAESAMEIYRGKTHVLAYVPTNRLYGIDVGERVVVAEGGVRRHGRIERIEQVTDSIPAEFQLTFRSVDRQQLMRITFDEEVTFPIQAKVKVTSTFSPTDLSALTRMAISGVGRLGENVIWLGRGLFGGNG
jgi:multidrug resistance efflux pump